MDGEKLPFSNLLGFKHHHLEGAGSEIEGWEKWRILQHCDS